MKTINYTKKPEHAELFEQWYDKFLQRLPYEPDTKVIETTWGPTEVVITPGAQQDPPIVLLHGAMSGAPHALGEVADLPAEIGIIAVNVPGQSPRAPQIRPSFNKGEYSLFMTEILDQLAIDKAVLASVSWGGSVAIDMMKNIPERIAGAILVVPGSIVRGSAWQAFSKLSWRIMRMGKNPSDEKRDWALEHIMTNPDPMWSPYLVDAMTKATMDFSIPPLAKPNELATMMAPVYIIAADQDIMFPGQQLIDRAKEIFPSFVGSHLLRNTNHSPSNSPEDVAEFKQIFRQSINTIYATISTN